MNDRLQRPQHGDDVTSVIDEAHGLDLVKRL
jgi:hypothetical protein